MNCPQCGREVRPGERFCRNCGAALAIGAAQAAGASPTVGLPRAVGAVPAPRYAGFWLRFAAWLIDCFIIEGVLSIIMVPFGLFATFFAFANSFALDQVRLATYGVASDEFSPYFFSSLAVFVRLWLFVAAISLVGQWFYHALFESSRWQATPGKKALGLVVTDAAGARISFGRATGRYFGKVLSSLILMIGYIIAAFTDKKQALHDVIAGTLVFRS